MPVSEARIDLGALRRNVRRLAESAPGSELMAVVKANAYGHGTAECARASREAGATWLGVATLEEALELRSLGDSGRVLAWLAVPASPWQECIEADVDLSVSTSSQLALVVDAARAARQRARIHLKIDTGLSRSGSRVADWESLLAEVIVAQDAGHVEAVAIWSHFASANVPGNPSIKLQVAAFDEAVEQASSLGVDVPLRHLANSAATLNVPESHYELVRPGISVYGISPGSLLGTAASLGLEAVMTFAATIAMVKRVGPGSGVSYGHDYVTEAETDLALVPAGFADGLPRKASGLGVVSVSGKPYPIRGRVCMDQVILELGLGSEVSAGEEAVIFGDEGRGVATAEDWARICETNSYEIVTGIGPRVPRIYRESS